MFLPSLFFITLEIEVSACFWRSMPMYYETQAYKAKNQSPPNKCPRKFRSIFCFGFSCRKNSSNILKFTTEIREALSKFQNLSELPWVNFLANKKIIKRYEVWPFDLPFFLALLPVQTKKARLPSFGELLFSSDPPI